MLLRGGDFENIHMVSLMSDAEFGFRLGENDPDRGRSRSANHPRETDAGVATGPSPAAHGVRKVAPSSSRDGRHH